MAELERLLIRLDATTEGLRRELAAADGRVTDFSRRTERQMMGIEKSFQRVGQAFGVFVGLNVARDFINSADAVTTLNNQLRAVTNSSTEFSKTQQEIFRISQQNKQSIADTTALYVRLSQAFTDQQKAQFPVLDLTEKLGQALFVTGVNAQQAQAFILQLSQASAADFKAVGQEINSLIESAPALTKAIAEELGLKSASALKKFAEDGKLNVNNFFEAFNRASIQLAKNAENMTITIEQSATRLNNAFLNYIGQSDAVEAGTSAMALGINKLADNFDTLADGALILASVIGGRLTESLIANNKAALSNAASQLKLASAVATGRASYINSAASILAAAQAEERLAAQQVVSTQGMLARQKVRQAEAVTALRNVAGTNAQVAAELRLSAVNADLARSENVAAAAATRHVAAQTALQGALTKTSLSAKATSLSMTTLSRAMGFFGGPIGLAITAITAGIVLLGDETDEAEESQRIYNDTIDKAKTLYGDVSKATGEHKQKLIELQQEQINSTRLALAEAEALLENARARREATQEIINQQNYAGVGFDPRAMSAIRTQSLPVQNDAISQTENKVSELKKSLANLIQIQKNGKTVEEESTEAIIKNAESQNAAATAAKNRKDELKRLAERLAESTTQNQLTLEQEEMLAKAAATSAEEYARVSDEIDIRNTLERQGFVIGTELYKLNEKILRQTKEATKAKDAANKAREDSIEKSKEEQRAFEEQQRELDRILAEPFINASNNVQNEIARMIESWDFSMQSFVDIAKRAGAEATAALIVRPVLESALDATGIIGSAASGVSGSSSNPIGSLLKEGTSLLGATKIGSAINAFGASALPSIFAPAVAGPTTLAAGLGGAPAAGGLLGGAGIGLSSLALPVAGLAIGALASRVFGSKPKSIASNFGGTIGEDGNLLNEVIRTNGKGDPETAKALSNGVKQVASALIAAGVDVSGQIVQGGIDDGRGFIGVGDTNYLTLRNGGGNAINFNPSGGEAAVSAAMGELALQLTKATEEGMKFADNLANIQTEGRKADEVLSDIAFIMGFDGLTETKQTFTELELAIQEMAKQFDEAAKTAERLGLSVEKVRQAERRRMDELLANVTGDIATQILQLTSPLEAQAQAERNRYAAQLRDLVAVGAKQQDIQMAELLHKLNIEKINASIATQEDNRLRTAQDLERRFAGIQGNMQGFLFELTNGRFSPLTPTDNLADMRSQVQSLGARAGLGDIEAQEQLDELLPIFVQLSGEINGFNALFEEDRKLAEQLTRNTLSVAERQVSLQQSQIAAIQNQTNVNQAGFAGLEAAIARLGGGVSANDVIGAAGVGLTPAQTWATQWGRSRGLLSSSEVAQNGVLAARLNAAGLTAQFERERVAMGFANGGLVDGIPGVDQNLARLSKGEFVIKPASVARIGSMSLQAMNDNSSGFMGQISSLNAKIDTLIQVVAASGQVTAAQLEKIASVTSEAQALEKAIAYTGRK